MALIRQHEFPLGVPTISARCIYCGGLWQPKMEATCIDRQDDVVRDRPRRISAIEDNDFLFDRLAELRRERDEALNAPADVG